MDLGCPEINRCDVGENRRGKYRRYIEPLLEVVPSSSSATDGDEVRLELGSKP